METKDLEQAALTPGNYEKVLKIYLLTLHCARPEQNKG